MWNNLTEQFVFTYINSEYIFQFKFSKIYIFERRCFHWNQFVIFKFSFFQPLNIHNIITNSMLALNQTTSIFQKSQVKIC